MLQTLADYYDRKLPDYYDYMYLDGFTPDEVYRAFQKTQRKKFYKFLEERYLNQSDNQPEEVEVKITSNMKVKK